MTPSQTPPSRALGKRAWIVVVIVVILALSLLLSYYFTSGSCSPNTCSNLISAVQISTLIGVVGILWLWVRSREP